MKIGPVTGIDVFDSAGILVTEVQVPSRQARNLKSWVHLSRGTEEHARQLILNDIEHQNSGVVFSPQSLSCGRLRAQTDHLERLRSECWHWDRIEAGMRTSEASSSRVALGAGSEKALRLKNHPIETNTADLSTKYLPRPRIEMLFAVGILVLVSGERGRNGEYMLMDNEVNRLLFIVALFLCVGGMFVGVLYDVHAESKGFQLDGSEDEHAGNGLDTGLEIAGTRNGWWALNLFFGTLVL